MLLVSQLIKMAVNNSQESRREWLWCCGFGWTRGFPYYLIGVSKGHLVQEMATQ